ncbi:MAG TPA: sigma-70 family RNA polymerase sigma factor [Sedimentisphaerales bacterium]|nr:sigma-70 family RNA polymerase sigma factor [Sedimentisphaerales bacterium]
MDSVNIDESVVLERVVYQQDRKALAILYAKYYQPVLDYIVGSTDHNVDAEDLAQNVFIELLQGSGRYKKKEQTVEAYLLGMAKNTVRRYRREKRGQPRTINSDLIDKIIPSSQVRGHQNQEMQIPAQELKKAIRDAVSQLSPKVRQAINLRFAEGLAPKEAAQKAGCPVNAFYQCLHAGIKELGKLRIGGLAQKSEV